MRSAIFVMIAVLVIGLLVQHFDKNFTHPDSKEQKQLTGATIVRPEKFQELKQKERANQRPQPQGVSRP